MKIHLDTDIGGDMDDLCALAMLLKWPDLDITGVTTVSDTGGRRAGYVRYILGAIALICGFTVVKGLITQSSLALAVSAFTVGLATLVGAGKQASP